MTKRSFLVLIVATVVVIGVVTAAEAVTSKITGKNNLILYGSAANPKGYFTVADDMMITEKLDARGNVSDSQGNLTLDDTVAITGDVFVEGDAEVKGTLYNSAGKITVNDDLYVGGLFSINSITTPTTSTCTTAGAMSYDSTYLYLCVAGNWKKVPLQSF